MNNNTISATLLEASKGLMLNKDSFSLIGFNAKGKLENVSFGTLRRDPKIGTVQFSIMEQDEDGKDIGITRKWAYAAFLQGVCTKKGKDYEYKGIPVEIIDGEISKV